MAQSDLSAYRPSSLQDEACRKILASQPQALIVREALTKALNAMKRDDNRSYLQQMLLICENCKSGLCLGHLVTIAHTDFSLIAEQRPGVPW